MALTQERLKEVLTYDPNSGIFRHNRSINNKKISAGQIAGYDRDGYLIVGVDGVYYKLHRLAFLYMTGKWPLECVDHADADKHNNAWNNLRDATKEENAKNRGKGPDNTSGWKGVTWHKRIGMWQARIGVANKRIHLGYYDDVREAAEAYIFSALDLHGEFARF